MKCEEIEMLLPEYIDRQLPLWQAEQVEWHIAGCLSCGETYRQTVHLFSCMDNDRLKLPAPSVRRNFEAMLGMLKEQPKFSHERIGNSTRLVSLRRIIAASFFILIGLTAGLLIQVSRKDTGAVASLRAELKDVKSGMVLTMLKNESPVERLRAVDYVEDISTPDSLIINSIVRTLNTDRNIHVRIAAASLLEKFADQKPVTDALLQSLKIQTEPMVQIVLMHILVSKKEQRARQPIQEILKNSNTSGEVKKVAKKSIALL